MANEDRIEEVFTNLYNSKHPEASEPKPVSGTALQDATGKGSNIYLTLKGEKEATAKIEIGPSEACADKIYPGLAIPEGADLPVNFKLPANWWLKVTVTKATIASCMQITH